MIGGESSRPSANASETGFVKKERKKKKEERKDLLINLGATHDGKSTL